MHCRLAGAALAAFSFVICSGAFAQQQDAPQQKPPGQDAGEPKKRAEPDFVPAPIKQFSDAAGQWYGWVNLHTRVAMFVAADGMVKFYGPRDVEQQATIQNDRLQLTSRNTDLDCGILNGFLTCHARFGTWYAELNLRKQ